MPDVRALAERLRDSGGALQLERALQPRGIVRSVGDGVARLGGLPEIGYEELLAFDSGALGMAYDLAPGTIGAILLLGAERVGEGDGARGLGHAPDMAAGVEALGRVLDPLGNVLDDGPTLPPGPRLPLFRPAPEIVERESVERALWTGVMAIDAAIPIGRGQRELIVGDRNVGKTALAIDIVSAQQRGDVACVYVVIGQPMSRVLSLREALRRQGCLDNTAIVAADASASPGLRYLAPNAGASLAEHFRDQGRDALVVYDDLTKHADAYRELALLLDRPPGREAYPGDIFYIHGELLERAAARRPEAGGGSVTALPLVETTDGDISSYIPTNLISITDGQIYLDAARFERDQRPAIDVGRSVSRIGTVVQRPLLRKAARRLRIEIARFESLEALTRVGLEMDVAMETSLRRGRLLRELLRQPRFARRGLLEQVLTLTAVGQDWLSQLPPERARAFMAALLEAARHEQPELCARLQTGEVPAEPWQPTIAPLAAALRARFAEPAA